MAQKQNGGRKEGEGNKGPRDIMRTLGIENTQWKSPLEFLLAVMNGDESILGEGIKPTATQKIDCARLAAPYVHQKMPSLVDVKVTDSWAEKTKEAESRVSAMRKPYEPNHGDAVH